jgi:hypothetical protein
MRGAERDSALLVGAKILRKEIERVVINALELVATT